MPALLSPAHIALIDQGVSVIVASRDAQLRPSVMRAMGSQISTDGGCITVYLRPSQARPLPGATAMRRPATVRWPLTANCGWL